MRKWVYKGKQYTIKKIDLEKPITEGILNDKNKPLVYNALWDKCFWLNNIQKSGNTNKLSAFLNDVYDRNRYLFTSIKHLYLVIENETN